MGEIKNYTLPNTKPTCVRYLFKIGYVSSGRILRQKMFFDKSYIELICSPDILADERHDMTVEEAISSIDEQGLRYEFEERAAILEYDGGLSRAMADVKALQEIIERMKNN